MKVFTFVFTFFCATLITGCAGINPPSAQEMAQIPIVRYGDTAPAEKAFILYYPAGASLPVNSSVNGDLLDKTDAAILHVTLKHDIYVYVQGQRAWASLDGKNWQRGNELVSGKFEMLIPGTRDGKNPGILHAEFNMKNN